MLSYRLKLQAPSLEEFNQFILKWKLEIIISQDDMLFYRVAEKQHKHNVRYITTDLLAVFLLLVYLYLKPLLKTNRFKQVLNVPIKRAQSKKTHQVFFFFSVFFFFFYLQTWSFVILSTRRRCSTMRYIIAHWKYKPIFTSMTTFPPFLV